jgi:polyferredoxin/Flp pilus assembly protein TadD
MASRITRSSPAPTNGCSTAGGGVALSLPVLPDAKQGGSVIRPSKNGWKRAIVLIIVHVLILAHIAQWLLTGRTTTPIEPSEAMEFTRQGIINAGLIFFAVALLATLVMGRWVCGWACHVVALQDMCGWMMKKCGVRPKPFRSRLLFYVPFLLALYMFVMPAAHRWGMIPLDAKMAEALGEDHRLVEFTRDASAIAGFPLRQPNLPPWRAELRLTTNRFWDTFPGQWYVIVPFFLICGFATVYFLGSKGFCTYGCPYGGFFAPLDRLSPARIRVTDACEGCGHCTAVCTSNVRVHEEVREYGMVVDPGCMKCLDCVSVCPKEALYFGFGRPSIVKGPAKSEPPKKRYDLTWPEEITLSLVFLGSLLAYRGVYGLIPLLMAVGMAGVTTYVLWKSWRLMRDANVNLHRFRLRFHGSLRPAGWAFAGAGMFVLLLTVHSGLVRGAYVLGAHHDDKVIVPAAMVYGGFQAEVPQEMIESADRGIALFRFASSIGSGGIGLLDSWQDELDMRLAWLHSVRGEFAEAEMVLRRGIARQAERSETFDRALATVVRVQGRQRDAMMLATEALLAHEHADGLLDEMIDWCIQGGRLDRALAVCEARLERFPRSIHTMRWRALLLLEHGRMDEALAGLDQLLALDPHDVAARTILSMALAAMGRTQHAYEALVPAVEIAPENPRVLMQMASVLQALGRHAEAAEHHRRALDLSQP